MKHLYYQLRQCIILICGLFLALGCERYEDLIEQVDFLGFEDFGICFTGNPSDLDSEVIFTDYETYQDYWNKRRIHPYNLDCDTAQLPNIDFDKYSLIGKYTEGGGCEVSYDRDIIEDKLRNRIIYTIKVEYQGTCAMLITSMNWVLIPKLKRNYEVEFVVE